MRKSSKSTSRFLGVISAFSLECARLFGISVELMSTLMWTSYVYGPPGGAGSSPWLRSTLRMTSLGSCWPIPGWTRTRWTAGAGRRSWSQHRKAMWTRSRHCCDAQRWGGNKLTLIWDQWSYWWHLWQILRTLLGTAALCFKPALSAIIQSLANIKLETWR